MSLAPLLWNGDLGTRLHVPSVYLTLPDILGSARPFPFIFVHYLQVIKMTESSKGLETCFLPFIYTCVHVHVH